MLKKFALKIYFKYFNNKCKLKHTIINTRLKCGLLRRYNFGVSVFSLYIICLLVWFSDDIYFANPKLGEKTSLSKKPRFTINLPPTQNEILRYIVISDNL